MLAIKRIAVVLGKCYNLICIKNQKLNTCKDAAADSILQRRLAKIIFSILRRCTKNEHHRKNKSTE